MADIRSFINSQLIEPLRQYPTVIQSTIIELITEKLETLYEYTVKFPEIVSPDQTRLDILKTIADQFLFTIREEADIQEQIEILDHILYVYNRRGSVDTIENMWEYYGGNLPKDVKVIIPSYNLFRYSVSKLSGSHVFQDNEENRPGSYEIRLFNNTYPIPELKTFLIRELVAAGNRIYFTNTLHMDITSDAIDSNNYLYDVQEDSLLTMQLQVLKDKERGFTWSSNSSLSILDDKSKLSGNMVIFFNLDLMREFDIITMNAGSDDMLSLTVSTLQSISAARYIFSVRDDHVYVYNHFLYCTPLTNTLSIGRYLYNSYGELVEDTTFSGYYVLGSTLLGQEVR